MMELITRIIDFTLHEHATSKAGIWPKPNFVNPERRRWAIPFIYILTALTTVIVALRIFVRITARVGKYGLDDSLIIGAWVRILPLY